MGFACLFDEAVVLEDARFRKVRKRPRGFVHRFGVPGPCGGAGDSRGVFAAREGRVRARGKTNVFVSASVRRNGFTDRRECRARRTEKRLVVTNVVEREEKKKM